MGSEVSWGRRSMGREYRLSRDSRLREESDRRAPRVPADLRSGPRVTDGTRGNAGDDCARSNGALPNAAAAPAGASHLADTAARTVAGVTIARRSAGPIVGIDVGEDFL